MELIIIIIAIIAILIIYLMMKMNIEEMKKIALEPELNTIAQKYPRNTEIAKTVLEKLGNKTTKIEENENLEATLYLAIQDKILIGNTHDSYTRIQTIAHECLHSIQDRKMLIFNFIYSNIYFIYYAIICILVIFRRLTNEILYSNIFLILSFIYYTVRVFLENDAMIKAKYLAKEYMEEKEISTKEEIEKMIQQYDIVNDLGIKCVHYQLALNVLAKIAILSLVCFWR